MGQYFSDHALFQDGSDGLKVACALRAMLQVDLKDTGKKVCPRHAVDALLFLDRMGDGFWVRLRFGLGGFFWNDLGAHLCVRSQAAEISCQVDPRLRHQCRRFFNEFQTREE